MVAAAGEGAGGGLRLQLWIVDLMGFSDGEVMQNLVIQKGPALN